MMCMYITLFIAHLITHSVSEMIHDGLHCAIGRVIGTWRVDNLEITLHKDVNLLQELVHVDGR